MHLEVFEKQNFLTKFFNQAVISRYLLLSRYRKWPWSLDEVEKYKICCFQIKSKHLPNAFTGDRDSLKGKSMFTGIITDIGIIRDLKRVGDLRAEIVTAYDLSTVNIGASIACNGVCLTVVKKTEDSFSVDISAESVNLTNIVDWKMSGAINLERALKVGDELGGHIVSGHVDGVATIIDMHDEGDSTRVNLRAPDALAKYIAPKGSVSLNGTSLTVNEVEGAVFGINFIPHTKAVTIWSDAKVGDLVNLEIDTLARYVARLQDWK